MIIGMPYKGLKKKQQKILENSVIYEYNTSVI